MARAKVKSNREIDLETQIADVEALAKAAEKKSSFSAAVAARSRLAVLKADLQRLRAREAADRLTDPIKRVRAQQVIALDAGSMVAASRLAEVEAKLLIELERAKTAKAEAEMTDLGLEQLIGVVVAAIPTLPREAVEAIADAAQAALGVGEDDEDFDGDA